MFNCSFGRGFVSKLTITVTINATGKAITMESTVGQGFAAIITDWQVIALQIPSASADFLYSNTNQKTLKSVPITNPEINLLGGTFPEQCKHVH